jgi:hypothetical protein
MHVWFEQNHHKLRETPLEVVVGLHEPVKQAG